MTTSGVIDAKRHDRISGAAGRTAEGQVINRLSITVVHLTDGTGTLYKNV